MRLYLAGTGSRPWIITAGGGGLNEPLSGGDVCPRMYLEGVLTTKLYIAGGDGGPAKWSHEMLDGDRLFASRVNLLESFYYVQPWQMKIKPYLKSFMLDSGAFSLIKGAGAQTYPELREYTGRYCDFINENDIELFFEMDVDSVVGFDNVLKLREMIESETGKKPIPVWHLPRGKEQFLKDAEDYPYVALGGMTVPSAQKVACKHFKWFTTEAHRRGAKIHGLGFTRLADIGTHGFDSVDSTTWLSGNMSGTVFRFDGHTIRKITRDGMKLKTREVAINNFTEWVKLAEYLE